MDFREKKFLVFALDFRTILSRATATRTQVKNGDSLSTSSLVRVKSLSLPHFDNGFSPWILFTHLKPDILDLERFHLSVPTHAVKISEMHHSQDILLILTTCMQLKKYWVTASRLKVPALDFMDVYKNPRD
ncbi:hypothetical protein BG011_002379 [Mortierella polycephala]|uniref:Uncharacterized protein n=1 Tax=Mortierella polycephala TaxID=41804 RepID=A0A9P6Q4K0_9FUNG|nr:hypothetical protein BG011_002379 [Mortierella polycephala]